MNIKDFADLGDMDTQQLELFKNIIELLNKLQAGTDKKWNRTLPVGDYLIDRWEKARGLGFGKGTSIYDSSLVFGDVTVGENTWIGPFTILDGTGGLEIGSFCSISAGVQIYTHDVSKWVLSGGKAEYEKASAKIGSRCYICPNTVIVKGVTIGDGCIIGANSLVLNDIPEGSKAFGTPCKVIGRAKPEDMDGRK